ncbi:MAG: TIGR04086 family membrane protein [Clostridiales bacterium]|nr:TIGR04086 family membrane protein [Clostridiales bacterium]
MAFIATLACMLALAAVVVFANLPDGVLMAVNQVVKVASIFLGVRSAVGAGGRRGFAMGTAVGLIYMALGYGLYCLLDGGLSTAQALAGEFGMGAAVGAVSGAIVANLKPSRRTPRTSRV